MDFRDAKIFDTRCSQSMTKSDHKIPAIQVLERMFSLVDALAAQPEPVSLKDLSERTGLHPSTAHRILNDLAIGRYVDRPEAGSYRLGMRLLELGVRCMAAGIFDDQGKLIAGLSVSAPADRLEESWAERVRATAAQISAALGHRSS